METTLQHELVHVVIHTLGGAKTRLWLAEAIALYVGGEGKVIQQNAENKLKGVAQRSYDDPGTASTSREALTRRSFRPAEPST